MTRRARRRRKRRAGKAARSGKDADSTSELRSEPATSPDGPAADDRDLGSVEEAGFDPDASAKPGPPGRRRLSSKRRERAVSEVAGIDPPDGDERRDRTTSEVLFDDRPDDTAPDPVDQRTAGEQEADAEQVVPAVAVTEAAAPADADADGGEAVPADADPEVLRRDEASADGASADGVTVAPADARRRRGPLLPVLVGVVVIVAGIIAAQLGWLDLARDIVVPGGEAETPVEAPEDGWQPAFLLATVDGHGRGGELKSLAVLATDRREDRGTVLLIPATIVTDVPGFGSFTLREAWELGGSSLVAVTVDNLLGMRIDGILAIDDEGWAGWFEQPGGASINVTAPINPSEEIGEPRIEAGQQQMDPETLGRYAIIRGQGESALDVLPRTRQVLDALFSEISEDPAALEAVVDAARTYPGTAAPGRIRTVMGELADARDRDRLTSVSLPVIPLGSGEEGLFRIDDERVDSVIDDRFAASRADRGASERYAVQILNGNGLPGVGQDVADELADGSYRIVLTGNADRFSYSTTRIVVYSEDAEILRAAQDVQERLGGIGTIERSGTPQSVVDLTIVVGHDFPA